MDRREFSRHLFRGAAGASVAAAGGAMAAGSRAGDTLLEQLVAASERLSATVNGMSGHIGRIGSRVEELGARVDRLLTLQRALLILLLVSYAVDGGMLFALLNASPVPLA